MISLLIIKLNQIRERFGGKKIVVPETRTAQPELFRNVNLNGTDKDGREIAKEMPPSKDSIRL